VNDAARKPKIGFIGIGLMGEPMARHLLSAGHPVKVWNRSPEKLQRVVAEGAVPCTEASDAGRDAAAVICMLSDGPTCDKVLFDDGVVASMTPGATLIVMSSIPVETAVAQAAKAEKYGVRYLDAPVSGGQRGAQQATLAIMAGGAESDFEAVKPILAVLGRPVRVGPAGTGELAKLANQMIVAGTIATVSEAILFVQAGGADPAKVREALTGGFADSPILQQHAKRMIDDDFRPGGPAKWQLKDVDTALAYAQTLGLSLPMLSLVRSLFENMVAHGDGDIDHAGLIRELRRRNGLEPSPRAKQD
jgi:3-hydroxyisobutyrate dehydrogenase-like beta-hydroxyacid dehydrogenase